MQDVQELNPTAATGLRERKRLETHARIQSEAMRLFLAGGFETTTLDDIAAAAGVSRRTLFHYFSSKEEIVFAAKADFPNLIVQAINRRPADEPLLTMVEMALMDLAAGHETPEAKAFARLIHDTPALNAGDQAKYEKVERLVAATLAARKGLAADDLDCRITAAAAVGILKLSTEAWLADDGARPEAFGQAAFAALRRVASDRRDD